MLKVFLAVPLHMTGWWAVTTATLLPGLARKKSHEELVKKINTEPWGLT